ncbi:MAG TPA: hypothetical protein VM511_01870, partial [Luteolibacter sp.]|nr:hypothetical protein [Luteolibacter sp.]
DETVAAFLDRIAAEAKAREDGALGLRIKELRRILTRTYSYGTQDNRGMDAYVSGQNQETAGEMALAVISYQQALKSGSELVPAKRIGERLEAIKKSHPAEYEKGVEKFLNLSVSPNLQGGERPAPKQ